MVCSIETLSQFSNWKFCSGAGIKMDDVEYICEETAVLKTSSIEDIFFFNFGFLTVCVEMGCNISKTLSI